VALEHLMKSRLLFDSSKVVYSTVGLDFAEKPKLSSGTGGFTKACFLLLTIVLFNFSRSRRESGQF
jgi:hypothetical protein